jgi:nucleoside-diphosphate-sugar epimerase
LRYKLLVAIGGIDGYIGWALALHLVARGHKVVGVDNFVTRRRVEEVGSWSATPILDMYERAKVVEELMGKRIEFVEGDLKEYSVVRGVFRKYEPDAFVHLGEQRSAPYSMIDVYHAVDTQVANIASSLNIVYAMKEVSPKTHLVKMGCYSEDTEVLTEEGWKKFYDLNRSDRVCCLDTSTQEIVYHKPSKIVRYPYSGKMLRIQTQSFDFLVTPNHRIVYRKAGALRIKTAEEVFGETLVIPKTGVWNAAETPDLPLVLPSGFSRLVNAVSAQALRMEAWLGFFGWYLAKGFARRRSDGSFSINFVVDLGSTKLKALKEALSSVGFKYAEFLSRDRLKLASFVVNLEITDTRFIQLLSDLGTLTRKFIPQRFKNMGRRQLGILFDSLITASGRFDQDTNTISFLSGSERLLDDVQEIACKLGYDASINSRTNPLSGETEKYLTISHSPNETVPASCQTWEHYEGYVYCCTVPTGVIMVRRNGKAGFSGNTMGEYGTPNVDVPEGFFEVEYNGRRDYLPFPRMAGSWYHWSKVHDSGNMMFANKIWGLSITDVMQGVVYGTRIDEISDERLHTRFDFDEVWGTALNRFCVQTVLGLPMTVYGKGGQTRGFISLSDSIQCLTIAIEKPADKGEYRVLNQFDEAYSVLDLAKKVFDVSKKLGLEPAISSVPNPRVEAEQHYYNPIHEKLKKLGYQRTRSLEAELHIILKDLVKYRSRLEEKKDVIHPRTDWRKSKNLLR